MIKYLKIAGMIGAATTALIFTIGGQHEIAAGIISAAFASASSFSFGGSTNGRS